MGVNKENRFQNDALVRLKLIGVLIKEERVKRGMTQKQLADELGYSQSYISRFERGDAPTKLVWFIALILRLNLHHE